MSSARTLQSTRSRRQFRQKRGGRVVAAVLSILAIGGIGWFAYYTLGTMAADGLTEEMVTDVVVRAPFDHIVLEQGEVESSSNIDVVCEVKSRGSGGTPILWVIDEGTYVKEGDKLVELDSSSLETEIKQQRISVSNAEALVIGSEAAVETANISLREYTEGTFLQEEKAIESEIFVATQELFKARLKLDEARRLGAKGVIKKLQIESEEFAVQNAKNILEAAEAKLTVLKTLTFVKNEVQFKADIETAKARLTSDQSVLSEEQDKLKEIEDQMAKCVMYSPAEGVVVHNNSFSSRGGAEFVVEEGASVRERQTIIKLPDPSKMQVKAAVNESRITLITQGMPCKVKVSAVPNEMLARVMRVNKYAEPGSWFSSSVKEYATYIEIIDPPEAIRTGMTAEVRIFVEQIEDALQIPVHGIYEFKGRHFCLKKDGETLSTVEIKIGATNESQVTIESGLDEQDVIVLNPRKHLDLMDFPEIEEESDRGKLAEIGASASTEKVEVDGPGEGGRPAGGGGGPAAIVEKLMSAGDTNNDGKIDAAEITALGEQGSRMNTFDSDGDGEVTKAEMLKKMQSGGGGGRPGGAGGRPGGGGGRPGGGGGRPNR